MKSLLISIVLVLPSLSFGKTLYRVTIETGITGVCYANPIRVTAPMGSEELCEQAMAGLVEKLQADSTLSAPDQPAQPQITQWFHEGEAATVQYYCFKNDEEFNRKLGNRLCGLETINGGAEQPSARE